MCLHTKQYKFQAADEDIVCWKVLEIVKGYDGEKIITPFAFCPVPEDVLNGEMLFKPEELETEHLLNRFKRFIEPEEDKEDKKPYYPIEIEEGVIHTYGAKELRADDMYDEMAYHVGFIGMGESYIGMYRGNIIGCGPEPNVLGIALYKCVIPKGTEYIEGKYFGHGSDSNLVSYGSKAIRFVEKVAEWRRSDGYDTGNTCLRDKVRALRKEVTHEEE